MMFPILLIGQQSLEEIKKNVYSNPFSEANQNYIRLMEEGAYKTNTEELFLLKDWGKMAVIGYGDIKLEVDSANYVITDDKIYFIDEGKLYHLFPGQVEQLAIASVIFGCYYYEGKSERRKLGYFEILIDGELDLLKKYKIKNRKVNNNPMGIGNKKVEQYQAYDLYYFDPDEQIALPVPSKKGKIIDLFGRKRSKMIDFARERDLSLNSENDVKLLFAYYNMLVQVQANEQN
jgi:hypothetical protein